MPYPFNEFKLRLLDRLSTAALRRARPYLARKSNTLARAMRAISKSPERSAVEVPHYWALYVHDGRGAFAKQKLMVWFRDPKDDPRLQGGKTPRRASQLRSLTRDQFLAAMKLREDWIRGGGDPYDSPVIVTRYIRRRTPAFPFFGNEPGEGMFGFVDDANRIGSAEFSDFVRRELGGSFKEKDEINGTLSI